MRIRFLGTGGGRYVTAYQLRRTGGFLIEDRGVVVHVDPGPGAARALREFGEDVRKIRGLIISHAHPDHITDAPILIEGITEGVRRRRGFLAGPETVLRGIGDYRPLGSYHLGALERSIEARAGKEIDVGAEVLFIPAHHTEEKALGFVWRGSKTLTYYTDTGYWEGMEKYAVDVVILNLETMSDVPKHTHPGVARKLLEGASPNLVILTHFGLSVLRHGPEKIASRLEREFGVDVIVAEDGMEWRKGKDKTLFDF